MKIRWTVLIALISLLAGVAGASLFWRSFTAQFMNYGFVVRTEADIVTRVALLEHIRAGRIAEATRLLETLLDGDLVGVSALARDGTKFSANTRRAVDHEHQARVVSGYEPSDQNVRNAVNEAFHLLASATEGTDAQPIIPPDLSRQDTHHDH